MHILLSPLRHFQCPSSRTNSVARYLPLNASIPVLFQKNLFVRSLLIPHYWIPAYSSCINTVRFINMFALKFMSLTRMPLNFGTTVESIEFGITENPWPKNSISRTLNHGQLHQISDIRPFHRYVGSTNKLELFDVTLTPHHNNGRISWNHSNAMGRGSHLSSEKKAKAKAFHAAGLSNGAIAKGLRRSPRCYARFSTYGQKKSPGRPSLPSSQSRGRSLYLTSTPPLQWVRLTVTQSHFI